LVAIIHSLGATHLDNFPDDLREVVHDHWGTFPPQHPLIVDLVGVILFLLWTISFLGNGCVIYIFLTTKSIRTPVGDHILDTDSWQCCFEKLFLIKSQVYDISHVQS